MMPSPPTYFTVLFSRWHSGGLFDGMAVPSSRSTSYLHCLSVRDTWNYKNARDRTVLVRLGKLLKRKKPAKDFAKEDERRLFSLQYEGG